MASQLVELEQLASLIDQAQQLDALAPGYRVIIPMSIFDLLLLVEILNDVCFNKKRVLRASNRAAACRLGTKISGALAAGTAVP